MVRNGPRLDLRGTWTDFRWPLAGKVVPFHSPSGDFTLQGTWPYSVHATGMAQARDLPPMPTTIDGSLAKDRFTFTKGDVDLSPYLTSLVGFHQAMADALAGHAHALSSPEGVALLARLI